MWWKLTGCRRQTMNPPSFMASLADDTPPNLVHIVICEAATVCIFLWPGSGTHGISTHHTKHAYAIAQRHAGDKTCRQSMETENGSYSVEDEQHFWTQLHDLVTTKCDSHEAIDDVLRSYLGFTSTFQRTKPSFSLARAMADRSRRLPILRL